MNYPEKNKQRIFNGNTFKGKNVGRIFRLPALAISSSLLLMTLASAPPSLAENIAIPNSSHQGNTQKPPKGINKSQVESRFGSPQSKYGPTGDPAIYYWEYPEYTVYFEDNIVIHTVSKSKSLKVY